MKRHKVLVITVIIIIAVILGAGLWYRHVQNSFLDGPGMVYEPDIAEFSYYHGGSSIGDLYRLTLSDGTIHMENCPANGMDTEEKARDVGIQVYTELERIAEENDMHAWTALPKSDIIALDAARTSVTIRFADGAIISFSSDDELPDGGWKAVDEMVEILESQLN